MSEDHKNDMINEETSDETKVLPLAEIDAQMKDAYKLLRHQMNTLRLKKMKVSKRILKLQFIKMNSLKLMMNRTKQAQWRNMMKSRRKR